ncbi:hypothetical protein [Burkholderia anthina]|uniref:hypothetical protein n=1 Tax=Burkholderia anthina TaxID=179879 RepID=UPI0037BE86F9
MPFRIRRYPHNDLLNLAHYHHQTIEKKRAAGDNDGIALDCTSCLIALAFSVEALFNFVGSQKVREWDERAHSPEKVATLAKSLNLPLESQEEPYEAIKILRTIRNGLAHGQPHESTADVSSHSELARQMQAPWDPYRNPDTVFALHRQVKDLQKKLFEAAGIRVGETLTSAIGSTILTHSPKSKSAIESWMQTGKVSDSSDP